MMLEYVQYRLNQLHQDFDRADELERLGILGAIRELILIEKRLKRPGPAAADPTAAAG